MPRYIVGVDIGGTFTETALFDEALELVHRCEVVKTTAMRSGEELIGHILGSLDAGLAEQDAARSAVLGIGMGAPGPLDIEQGLVMETPNLPVLTHFPLKKQMSQASGVPVLLDNDANIFTLGEAMKGAAQGYPYVLGVTLGTGFG